MWTNLLRDAARSLLRRVGLLESWRALKRRAFTYRQNRLTDEQLSGLYERAYHQTHGYGHASPAGNWASDEAIKAAHARAIVEALPSVRRVLVGGCSTGMAVIAFRRLGIDAWGFDVTPDLQNVVLSEARPFVRCGSLTDIPFAANEQFDLLVTTDVLEHVQLRSISRVARECDRLAFPWMAHLINHTAMTPDHMTLMPLRWWVRQFPSYRLREDIELTRVDDPRIYGLNGDSEHVYTFWQRT